MNDQITKDESIDTSPDIKQSKEKYKFSKKKLIIALLVICTLFIAYSIVKIKLQQIIYLQKKTVYFKELNITLPMIGNFKYFQQPNTIKLYNDDGFIIVDRHKVDYTSIEDAVKNTKNEKLKQAKKSYYETKYGLKGIISYFNNSDEIQYSIYSDNYIYNFNTSSPKLTELLDTLATQVYLGDIASSSISTPTITSSIPTKKPITGYFISRKSSAGIQDIIQLKERVTSIVRWKDNLLYSEEYGNKGILTVYLHNIKKGTTRTIFSKHSDLNMSGLNVIDNTLFFSLGDYLQKGESYYIDLNDKDFRVIKLIDISGYVTKISGRYYFISGEGDACWSTSDFYLIDLRTNKLTHVADTAVGCGGGDEKIAITNDYMILAKHGDKEKQISADIYLNLFKIDLDNPDQKTFLLSNENMPINITRIKYSEDQNKIMLVGNNIYVYDLNNNSLNNILVLPKEFSEHKYEFPEYMSFVTSWDKNIACIEKTEWEPYKKYKLLIDLNNKSISQDTSRCPPEKQSEDYKEKTPQEIFKELNLPSNYLLVQY